MVGRAFVGMRNVVITVGLWITPLQAPSKRCPVLVLGVNGMPKETWTSRDLPVLEAIVEMVEEGIGTIERRDLVDRTGFDAETVRLAVGALAHEDPRFFGGYIVMRGRREPDYDFIKGITGHARRAVGVWPTPDSLAQEIIKGLERAADATEDEEESGRLRRTARWFGDAGRDVLVGVISAALAGGAGAG